MRHVLVCCPNMDTAGAARELNVLGLSYARRLCWTEVDGHDTRA